MCCQLRIQPQVLWYLCFSVVYFWQILINWTLFTFLVSLFIKNVLCMSQDTPNLEDLLIFGLYSPTTDLPVGLEQPFPSLWVSFILFE